MRRPAVDRDLMLQMAEVAHKRRAERSDWEPMMWRYLLRWVTGYHSLGAWE